MIKGSTPADTTVVLYLFTSNCLVFPLLHLIWFGVNWDGSEMKLFLNSTILSEQSQRSQCPSWKQCLYWVLKGFPDNSVGKESTCSVGDLDLIPGLGRSPGEGKGYPLQYSGLGNSMDWIVHGIAESGTYCIKKLFLRWFFFPRKN